MTSAPAARWRLRAATRLCPRQRAGRTLRPCDSDPGLASGRPYLLCQRAPRRKAVRDDTQRPTARRRCGQIIACRTALAPRSIPALAIPHAELILRKGFRAEIDSYSAFLENDHFTATGLAGYLRERGLRRLFLCGLAYDFCVRFSAIDGTALDFECLVIGDATRAVNLPGSVLATDQAFEEAGIQRITVADRHWMRAQPAILDDRSMARGSGHCYSLRYDAGADRNLAFGISDRQAFTHLFQSTSFDNELHTGEFDPQRPLSAGHTTPHSLQFRRTPRTSHEASRQLAACEAFMVSRRHPRAPSSYRPYGSPRCVAAAERRRLIRFLPAPTPRRAPALPLRSCRRALRRSAPAGRRRR